MNKKLKKQIEEASEIIKAGGLVAYPTETVYGLGADPFNRIAILKVFAAKSREFDKPLSVAVSDINQMDELVYTNSNARKISKEFLPGPITLILKKKAILPSELTSNSDKLGIRMPDNEIALELIKKSGPITATSANISGNNDARNAKEVEIQLGSKIDYILNGGECKTGKPSTVVDLSEENDFQILREGDIKKDSIEKLLS